MMYSKESKINKAMNTFLKVIIIYFIALLLSINGLFAQTSNKINWKEDLKIYKKSLEQKHIDLYHTVPKEEFLMNGIRCITTLIH